MNAAERAHVRKVVRKVLTPHARSALQITEAAGLGRRTANRNQVKDALDDLVEDGVAVHDGKGFRLA